MAGKGCVRQTNLQRRGLVQVQPCWGGSRGRVTQKCQERHVQGATASQGKRVGLGLEPGWGGAGTSTFGDAVLAPDHTDGLVLRHLLGWPGAVL